MGRPTGYTLAIGLDICAQLASGKPLTKICEPDGMPGLSTVYAWLQSQPAFRDMYARAREDQAETMADEIIKLADDATDPVKARLQVDARKWVASKLKPKKYGDKVTNEHTGADGAPISVSVNFVGKPA